MILNFGPNTFKLTSTGCGASDVYTLTTFEDNDCTTASGTYEVTGTMACTTVADFYASVNCLTPVEPVAPVAEPVAEPIAAPMAEPMTEPIAAPMTEPIAAPMTEPVAEPISAPVSAPAAAQPVAAPVKSNTPVKKSNAVVVGSSMALIGAGIVLAF
jgi:hypothetical protein